MCLQAIVERATGSQVCRLLDDSAFVAPTLFRAGALQAQVVALYELLGVPVQLSKLLPPATSFKFLGFLVDLYQRALGLPPSKWDKLEALLGGILSHRRAGAPFRVKMSVLEEFCGFAHFCIRR